LNIRANANLGELSEILAHLGVSEGAKLASALDIGAYLGQFEGLQLLAAGERQQLGELLRAAKRLAPAQLEDALAEQGRSGAKLGEILMQRGLLGAAECEVLLAFQQRQCGQARSVTKLHLGNVLVATEEITREQLAEALLCQSERGGRLGEVLVAAGHASERQVTLGLQLQRKLVAAVLLVAMALVSPFAANDAQAAIKGAGIPAAAICETVQAEIPRSLAWGIFDAEEAPDQAAPLGPAAPGAERGGQVPGQRKAMRLLIADDHEVLRTALRSVLEREPDIEVVGEAGDGEAMLARARELSPDLVLMDIAMPGLNGIEATRRITGECPGAKVLAFSSHLERRFVEKMLEYGALGYVSKAAGRDELLQGLRAVAQGKPYLCRETAAMMGEARQAAGAVEGEHALARSESEVLRQIANGESAGDIASRLALAPGAVEIHRRNAMRKLGLRNADELRQYALGAGLIGPPAGL
jgi:two-component system NarL family response regulator